MTRRHGNTRVRQTRWGADMNRGLSFGFCAGKDTNGVGLSACVPARALYPPVYLDGQQFLDYMGQLHGTPVSQASVTAMCVRLDLEPAVLQKQVRTCSKDISQKLALAACLLSERELLIFDEPMSSLDPGSRALLKTCLLERKPQGQTLLFATHLLHDGETLCDRLVILDKGRLPFVGTPAECCDEFQQDSLGRAYLAATA
jgi:ABC-2 type transport system ATP-binding protein